MILRRDRYAYCETTADISTKPRWIVDFLIVIEQGLLIWSGYKSDREGGGEEGGSGSLALAKLQIPALVLARYPKPHAIPQS